MGSLLNTVIYLGVLLNGAVLYKNVSELWPPIRAVEREATVLPDPSRP